MLVALKNNGELFMLQHNENLQALKKMRNEQSFFCPQCNSPLLLKVGKVKIPHFAHVQHSSCESTFSEGETAIHLLGKQQLYHHFHTELNLHVQLEATIPNFTQRPDLFIEHNDDKYAIEFQYSNISYDVFRKRTEGYFKQQITPIWLVHTPQKYVQGSVQKITLTHYIQQFLICYKGDKVFITYCPKRESFFYYHHFLHVYKNTYICCMDELPLKKQSFPFFYPKPISLDRFSAMFHLHQEYLAGTLRSKFYYSREGVQDLFLRYLYELRLSLGELPIYLKMPLRNGEQMNTVSSGWQCALFYCAQQLQKPIWLMNRGEIKLFFQLIKLPINQERLTILRQFAQVCKKLQITSPYEVIEEQKLINILYGLFIAK